MRNTFALAMLVAAGSATAQVQVTEVFVGLSGEDGTADWFELTNFGGAAVDTASFWYDDDSNDFLEAGQLPSFILGPGESAVFLTDAGAADDVTYANSTDEFLAIWGSVANVGVVEEGGNLGQGGDAINIFDAAMNPVTSFAIPASLSGFFATVENVGSVRNSVLGENGAYASAEFFNDNIGTGPDFMESIVGSPGVVPAPASVALLVLGGLGAATRRR